MSRTFAMVVLGTALGFLAMSSVLAADKPTVKQPPSATAKDRRSCHDEKAARTKPAVKERSRPAVVQPLPAGGQHSGHRAGADPAD